MPTGPRPRDAAPVLLRWVRPASLAALAFLVTAPGVGNRFTQDDLPLIYRNEAVQRPTNPAAFFVQPYWHDPFPPALYRPLAIATLSVQWRAGGGEAAVFRWVSAILLAGAAIALFALALQCLSVAAAWAAAALFVVHPVHVEATALGVNQGELFVGLLLCLAAGLYLRHRKRGELPWTAGAAIVLLFVFAALFKENALVFPLILIAAELTVIADPGRPGQRVRQLRPFYLALGLAAVVVLAARSAVLGGDVVGTFTAEALAGQGVGGRTLTMLGVIPEWARLLLWPGELQADYGPNEIVAATGFHLAQWAGIALLVMWAAGCLISRRRHPALAFGLAWTAIALLPVSNVFLPTGIVLGERTLFLATAGVGIAAGAVLSMLWRRLADPVPRPARVAGVSVLLALIALGVMRSRSRTTVWRDQKTLLHQTVLDAPKSYTARLALVRFLEDSGSAAAASTEYRAAVSLKPALAAQDLFLADQYRSAGLCTAAVRLYRRVLSIAPGDSRTLESVYRCLRGPETDSTVPRPPR